MVAPRREELDGGLAAQQPRRGSISPGNPCGRRWRCRALPPPGTSSSSCLSPPLGGVTASACRSPGWAGGRAQAPRPLWRLGKRFVEEAERTERRRCQAPGVHLRGRRSGRGSLGGGGGSIVLRAAVSVPETWIQNAGQGGDSRVRIQVEWRPHSQRGDEGGLLSSPPHPHVEARKERKTSQRHPAKVSRKQESRSQPPAPWGQDCQLPEDLVLHGCTPTQLAPSTQHPALSTQHSAWCRAYGQ
ncbi:uncharacterized protein LOC125121986 [Phacochoerus africanus]|uniref:uncharacterized protein LOC125121986 n=1 Tax=Phacochoerus africanus TaxID=41426 RepID=UPI001FDA7CB6|nr:uncharacterized protein LOC125121986 [Phacochoerus africanus]